MFSNKDLKVQYKNLLASIKSTIAGEANLVTVLATVVAILHEELNKLKDNQLNWTGVYYVEQNGDLVLGPFQGKYTHSKVRKGTGVCGRTVEKREIIIISDLKDHKDNILPSESLSRSEIALPIIVYGKVVGVLDLFTKVPSGFSEMDREGLNQVVQVLQGYRWTPVAFNRVASYPLYNSLIYKVTLIFAPLAAFLVFFLANASGFKLLKFK
jgi:GAF domain-containing protein